MQKMAFPGRHALEDPSHSHIPSSYAPLLDSSTTSANETSDRQGRRRRASVVALPLMAVLLVVALFSVVALVTNGNKPTPMVSTPPESQQPENMIPPRRGEAEGVSLKSFRPLLGAPKYSWTNKLLAWQKTGFHFQPKKNWMNGPVFYKGWYHFFYQYNPYGAVWGNIAWGHAVSRDLIHWRHLPMAMVPDDWYDINGVWTGSATILEDGRLVMLYTGSTNESVQVQNLAYPADPSDPLLVDWVKYPGNPVLVPPPGIGSKDFRDPTTAWLTPQGKWRFIIGSKLNKTGISLVYDTKDFKTYELLNGLLHSVPGTGMWECVDIFPVSKIVENGLDTGENGPGVKHVVKTSLDDDKNDYYALGTYDGETGKWTPDDPINDVGIGLRYDYGTFYASKTFYDQEKKRRVLWGWIKETDSENADILKRWASVQAIPRTILFDKKTGKNILQWPVEEVERLRMSKKVFDKVEAKPGSVVPLHVGFETSQLDIVAEFEVDKAALESINGTDDTTYSCPTSHGAAHRGALGPFGLLVHTDDHQTEQTAVYFYISKDTQGNCKTFFCADHSRSSEAIDVDKSIYGSTVPVLEGEKLSMRILVDHSIVESFGQGGRTCITSRIYPARAVYENAGIFLFNNATDAAITASLHIWQMSSAYAHS
ncbi:Beta-fructofuranosidase, soluble isoenzyme I [Sesamum angolense]|uniref:beta-fructofuranosidase n=1 Tax=Sesamum angolense TaxID=2727404 RepID=A0AAE2BWH5_9LAMI|nr:Beta-fructofuranosidase, soluble isoenzyme I [Sesamum angolense]